VSDTLSAAVSPYIALVGSPNTGKTSLFNALTGSRQKVGNYTGVTVERKEGELHTPQGRHIKILDLPGTYSLRPVTMEEAVTEGVLLKGQYEKNPPSLLVAVADATNLERSLNFVLELKELGIPTLLALNMMDLARRRGLKLNMEVLQRELALPVIPLVATQRRSMRPLLDEIDRHWNGKTPEAPTTPPCESNPKERLKARYGAVDRILKAAQQTQIAPSLWTERIDRVVLHPLWGTLLLYLVLALVFQAIFTWATVPMDFLGALIEKGGMWVGGWLAAGWFRSLVVDGVIAGVGSVVVFLPQILFLFFFILLLEDSGYMARAAFLMDRNMRRVGLHGRAFIPLLSSFACAIPGIMAARTIERPRDRLVTILISPLMSCSARIPVYTLLIAAFIPNRVVWGWFRLQGLVMLGLYVGGLLVALAVAWCMKHLFHRGEASIFLLEMPTYKWPSLRNVWLGMWERARLFLVRAGTIILGASVLIWIISSYPKAPEPLPAGETAIEYSFAGQLGKFLEPAIKPIGFDWSIGVGLITGVVAREVIVSTLGTLYSVEGAEEGGGISQLSQVLSKKWSLATGLSLLVFFIFAMQCLSTLAVVRRETGSWKVPALMLLYMTGLAYGAAWVTYRIFS
jgi:ferrous iron transport protein B